MDKNPVVTSTVEMAKPTLIVQTPQVQPTTFTKADFLKALKNVSRKQEPPAAPEQKNPNE